MAIHYQHKLDRIFHALGDQTRRQMLTLLSKRGECTATELGKPFDIAQPSVSKHLRVLEQASLVSRTVDGRVHRFQLRSKSLRQAETWLARHQKLWENSLDALGDLVDKLNKNDDA